MSKIDAEDLRPLAYPEHHSLGRQNDARQLLREAIGETEQEVDKAFREAFREVAQNVDEAA
jgi:hypothetical protein